MQEVVKVDFVDYINFPKCPICNSALKYKDTKNRKLFDYGGECTEIKIRRLKCEKCNKLHSELPASVVPRRHYRKEVIKDVLEFWIDHDDPLAEDGPANITMDRWRSEINADLL